MKHIDRLLMLTILLNIVVPLSVGASLLGDIAMTTHAAAPVIEDPVADERAALEQRHNIEESTLRLMEAKLHAAAGELSTKLSALMEQQHALEAQYEAALKNL